MVLNPESEREADWQWGEFLRKLAADPTFGPSTRTRIRVVCFEPRQECVLSCADDLWGFMNAHSVLKPTTAFFAILTEARMEVPMETLDGRRIGLRPRYVCRAPSPARW